MGNIPVPPTIERGGDTPVPPNVVVSAPLVIDPPVVPVEVPAPPAVPPVIIPEVIPPVEEPNPEETMSSPTPPRETTPAEQLAHLCRRLFGREIPADDYLFQDREWSGQFRRWSIVNLRQSIQAQFFAENLSREEARRTHASTLEEQYQQALTYANDRVAEMEARVKASESQKTINQTKLTVLAKENQQLKDSNKMLEGNLEIAESRAENVRIENEAMQKKLDNVSGKYEKLLQEKTDLEGKLEKMAREITQLETAALDLEEGLADAEREKVAAAEDSAAQNREYLQRFLASNAFLDAAQLAMQREAHKATYQVVKRIGRPYRKSPEDFGLSQPAEDHRYDFSKYFWKEDNDVLADIQSGFHVWVDPELLVPEKYRKPAPSSSRRQ